MVGRRVWQHVVKHLLTERGRHVDQLLLRHSEMPVSPVPGPCLTQCPRKGLDQQTRRIHTATCRARRHPRGHAHLKGDSALADLPLLVAHSCRQGVALCLGQRIAADFADVLVHALLDLMLWPARRRPRYRSGRDGLEGLEPRGTGSHLSEVRDPIMRTQVRKVDALEDGESVTADAGLKREIEKALVSHARREWRQCECRVDSSVCRVSKCGGSGVHDVTLRRRSDSESASYAVTCMGAHDLFSSYAVIHNDARNPSGNLAAVIHNDARSPSGNLAAAARFLGGPA